MSWATQKAQQKENRDEDDSSRDSEADRGEHQVASARRSPVASPSLEKAAAESSSGAANRRIELQRRKEQRQHNVESLLSQITDRSNEIVMEIMSWKAGADEHTPERRDEMLQLSRKREWLQSQLQFYQSYSEADLAPLSINCTFSELSCSIESAWTPIFVPLLWRHLENIHAFVIFFLRLLHCEIRFDLGSFQDAPQYLTAFSPSAQKLQFFRSFFFFVCPCQFISHPFHYSIYHISSTFQSFKSLSSSAHVRQRFHSATPFLFLIFLHSSIFLVRS